MKESTLPFLACPDCRNASLDLTEALFLDDEVETGTLTCKKCLSVFPVILGIPRLLPQQLIPYILSDFGLINRFPEAKVRVFAEPGESQASIVRTMLGYTFEHLTLQDQDVSWEENQRYFKEHSLLTADAYEGLNVLDVGCGDGRFVGCTSLKAKQIIGFDLSRGVELARRRMQALGIKNVDFVQGDIFHLPFVEECFDLVMSIGVLHHTPDPRRAFLNAARLLAPSGLMNIWVYGLQGMNLGYRLSHMVHLRRLIRSCSLEQRLRISRIIVSLLNIGLWGPTRLISRLGFARLNTMIKRLPVLGLYNRSDITRLRAVFDRIQPVETSYHQKGEICEWIASAGLKLLEIKTRGGRGWLALAQRVDPFS